VSELSESEMLCNSPNTVIFGNDINGTALKNKYFPLQVVCEFCMIDSVIGMAKIPNCPKAH